MRVIFIWQKPSWILKSYCKNVGNYIPIRLTICKILSDSGFYFSPDFICVILMNVLPKVFVNFQHCILTEYGDDSNSKGMSLNYIRCF